jgi:hypothetical protein
MTRFRCVQKSTTGRGAVIYLQGPGFDLDKDGVGDLDEAIAATLPGVGIASTAESGLHDTPSDLMAALQLTGAKNCDVLAGFSAGCQGVRNHLLRGLDPRVVVCIDGTHSSWPKLEPLHIGLWRERAKKARAGESMLVATCTAQRYTQRIKPPFAATSTVLAEALGLPEFGSYPTAAKSLPVYPSEPMAHRAGGLRAFAYPGTDCDAKAHVAQLTHVLPSLLATEVAPFLLGTPDRSNYLHASGQKLGELRGWLSRLAEYAVAATEDDTPAETHLARALAEVGQREIPGPKSNPRIDEYLALCVRGGKLLGLRGDDQFSWCAAFASWCGLPPGMVPRAAVAELVTDSRKLGLWRDAGHIPKAGDLAIYARAGGDPRKGGLGHVNRVISVSDVFFKAVGGNEADSVKLSERALTEPVGFVVYP